MKTLPLLASLAVTTAVSAADLKDPAAVAREWNQAVEKAREPSAPMHNLQAQSDALTETPLERIFRSDNLPPIRSPKPDWKFYGAPNKKGPLPLAPLSPGPLYDAPNYQIPPVLPDNVPPGSKLWEYNGQKYWLIPIGPDAGK